MKQTITSTHSSPVIGSHSSPSTNPLDRNVLINPRGSELPYFVPSDAFVHRLAEHGVLRHFAHVTFLSSTLDKYAPFSSARVEVHKETQKMFTSLSSKHNRRHKRSFHIHNFSRDKQVRNLHSTSDIDHATIDTTHSHNLSSTFLPLSHQRNLKFSSELMRMRRILSVYHPLLLRNRKLGMRLGRFHGIYPLIGSIFLNKFIPNKQKAVLKCVVDILSHLQTDVMYLNFTYSTKFMKVIQKMTQFVKEHGIQQLSMDALIAELFQLYDRESQISRSLTTNSAMVLPPQVFRRIEVQFSDRLLKKSQSTSESVNSFIGRTDHILFLDHLFYIRAFVSQHLELFM